MAQTFKQLLEELNACSEAIKWAGNRKIEQVVADCHRGDWLLWLAKNIDIDKRKLTLAKGHCANTIRHLIKNQQSIDAVDAAINYGNGLIDDKELINYAAAAADAAAAAYAAADADDDDDAAYAAAAYAAAYAAADAADADDAAAAAVSAAYADAAKQNNQKITADLCRMYIGQLIIKKVNELLNK